jgi:hypothetical protein
MTEDFARGFGHHITDGHDNQHVTMGTITSSHPTWGDRFSKNAIEREKRGFLSRLPLSFGGFLFVYFGSETIVFYLAAKANCGQFWRVAPIISHSLSDPI